MQEAAAGSLNLGCVVLLVNGCCRRDGGICDRAAGEAAAGESTSGMRAAGDRGGWDVAVGCRRGKRVLMGLQVSGPNKKALTNIRFMSSCVHYLL